MQDYTVYGLQMTVELTLPELLASPATQPDVRVYSGSASETQLRGPI